MHFKKKRDMFKTLEKFTPEEIWGRMMYMGTDNNIDLYKHYDTREYINIDDDGKFYKYNNGKYEQVKEKIALQQSIKFNKEMGW